MDSSNIQLYKEKFIEYLKSTKYLRNSDESNVRNIVNFIEFDLLKVIQTNLNVNLQVIYDFLNKDSLNELINETNSGRSLSSLNEQSGGLLRSAMNFYVGYLSSKKHPLAEKEKKNIKKKTPKESSSPQKTTEAEVKPIISEPQPYDKLEGKKYESSVTKYERSQGNRKDCIAHYGYVCKVCEINFEQTYGEIGKDFLEVHHLNFDRFCNKADNLIFITHENHAKLHAEQRRKDKSNE